MKIDVTIVDYRTPHLTEACVDSIYDSGDPGLFDMDVTVVDTSGDEGQEWPALGEAMLLHTQAQAGYAAGLNAGFRDSNADILVALNADTEWPARGVGALLRLFDWHPFLGIVGPRQVTPDGRVAHAGIEVTGDPGGGRGFGEHAEGRYLERYMPVGQVAGSVMLFRAECFKQIGGMPNTRLYFEDALACVRARRAGWTVAYSGLRTFVHHIGASPEPDGTSRAELAHESRRLYQGEVGAL